MQDPTPHTRHKYPNARYNRKVTAKQYATTSW